MLLVCKRLSVCIVSVHFASVGNVVFYRSKSTILGCTTTLYRFQKWSIYSRYSEADILVLTIVIEAGADDIIDFTTLVVCR